MALRTRKVRAIARDSYVPGLLGRVSKQIASAASVLYRQWLGMGINNARVVISLSLFPGSTATDLSADTGLHKAVVSRSLRVLRDRERLPLKGLSATQKRRLVEYLQRVMVNLPAANAYQPPASLRTRSR